MDREPDDSRTMSTLGSEQAKSVNLQMPRERVIQLPSASQPEHINPSRKPLPVPNPPGAPSGARPVQTALTIEARDTPTLASRPIAGTSNGLNPPWYQPSGTGNDRSNEAQRRPYTPFAPSRPQGPYVPTGSRFPPSPQQSPPNLYGTPSPYQPLFEYDPPNPYHGQGFNHPQDVYRTTHLYGLQRQPEPPYTGPQHGPSLHPSMFNPGRPHDPITTGYTSGFFPTLNPIHQPGGPMGPPPPSGPRSSHGTRGQRQGHWPPQTSGGYPTRTLHGNQGTPEPGRSPYGGESVPQDLGQPTTSGFLGPRHPSGTSVRSQGIQDRSNIFSSGETPHHDTPTGRVPRSPAVSFPDVSMSNNFPKDSETLAKRQKRSSGQGHLSGRQVEEPRRPHPEKNNTDKGFKGVGCRDKDGVKGPRRQSPSSLAQSSITQPIKKRKNVTSRSRGQGRRYHGEVQESADGSFIFRATGADNWEPTVQHEAVRGEMIRHMRSLGWYTREPSRGPNADDETSYHPSQKEWRFEGHHGWHHSQDRTLYRFERRDFGVPSYNPGPMRWRECIVLNRENIPITEWRNIPLTLSSKVEGGRMEEIQREDERIANHDFRDRQPSMSGDQPLQHLSALGNRKRRFREDNGLASWDRREGTDRITDLIRSHLNADQRRNNTTRGFDGLTREEFNMIKLDNKRTGKYLSRAGNKRKHQDSDEEQDEGQDEED